MSDDPTACQSAIETIGPSRSLGDVVAVDSVDLAVVVAIGARSRRMPE